MTARAAAVLSLAFVACAWAPEGPDRMTLAVIAAEHNDSGNGVGGGRLTLEQGTDPEWSVHLASQWIASRAQDFPASGGSDWDSSGEFLFGARRWWPVGPLGAGLGAEIGYGEGSPGDEDYALAVALATLRWDLELGAGRTLGMEIDLHYRAPLGLDGRSIGDGTPARDVFGGWLLFLGASYAW